MSAGGPRGAVLLSDVRKNLTRHELQQRQPDLLVDLVKGRLDEMGRDPVPALEQDCFDVASGISSSRPESGWQDCRLSKVGINRPLDLAPASRVLGLAVGLLGLDVHETPSPWAEAWLTFHDATRNCFGLGGLGNDDLEAKPVQMSDGGKPPRRHYHEEQAVWQSKVLERLKNLINFGSIHVSEEERLEGPPPGQAYCGKLGADFKEHLELAEFCLRRITHSVGALEDPAQQERPILLREYTEQQVVAVAKDLRQWLVQLGNLLGLYHALLLDLERERRRLDGQLQAKEASWKRDEERRRSAEHRFEKLDEIRKEERMKKQADFLLGLKLCEDDAKIYSQSEVDAMKAKWKREFLDPLLADIQELKKGRAPGVDMMTKTSTIRSRTAPVEDESVSQLKEALTAVSALADRTADREAAGMLMRLSSAIEGSTEESIPEIVHAIMAMKAPQPVVDAAAEPDPAPANEAEFISCTSTVSSEMGKLSRSMKGVAGMDSIAKLVVWVKDSVDAIRNYRDGFEWKQPPPWQMTDLESIIESQAAVRPTSTKGSTDTTGPIGDGTPLGKLMSAVTFELGKAARALGDNSGGEQIAALMHWGRDTINSGKAAPENPRWKPAPKWELGEMGTTTVSNSGNGSSNDKDIEAMWQARMDALRADYEARLRKAFEDLEAEKEKTAEALRRLAEETKRADDLIAKLRKKMLNMQEIMKKNGVGKQAEDAAWEAGLGEFMKGRDVFERLYRDAVNRMRRFAEAQVKMLHESNEEFTRNMKSLYMPMLGSDSASMVAVGSERASVALLKAGAHRSISSTHSEDVSPAGGGLSPGVYVRHVAQPRSSDSSPSRPPRRLSPGSVGRLNVEESSSRWESHSSVEEEGRYPHRAAPARHFAGHHHQGPCTDQINTVFCAKGYVDGQRFIAGSNIIAEGVLPPLDRRGRLRTPPERASGRVVAGVLPGSAVAPEHGFSGFSIGVGLGLRNRSPPGVRPRPPDSLPRQPRPVRPVAEAPGLIIAGHGRLAGAGGGTVSRLLPASAQRPPGVSSMPQLHSSPPHQRFLSQS